LTIYVIATSCKFGPSSGSGFARASRSSGIFVRFR
jgi:hypothetical protein